MRIHATRLIACTLSLALVAPLSGCLVADNTEPNIDTLGDPSIQDALDQTSEALSDVANALDTVQSDIADAINSVTGTLKDLSDLPTILADLFSQGGVLAKAQTATVEDAQSGDVLATYDEPTEITQLVESLSTMDYAGWQLVSSRPDAAEEYVIRVSEDETIRLGQDPNAAESVELFTITTFTDSPVIELDIPSLSFGATLELPESDIALIRSLG